MGRFLRGKSAASAIAQVAMTNGFVLCINVLTGVVAARFLGPQGRGQFAAITLWPQLLGYAFAFALPSALVYHAKKHPQSRASIAAMAIALSAIGGGLAFGAGESLMPTLLRQATPDILRDARWMMLFAIPATVSTVLIALLQLEERFHLYNRVRYLPLLLTLGCLVALAVSGRLTPLSAALAYFLPGVPIFLWLAWWAARHFRPRTSGARGFIRPLVSYSGRAYGGEAAGTLLIYLDKIFLVNLLSPASYGVYVVVFNLSRIITTLSAAAAPVLLPKSAGRSIDDVIALTGRVLSIATPLLLVPAVGFVLCGRLALRILYGVDFTVGYWALGCLIVEAVVSSVTQVITQPYLALNRPGVVTIIQATSLPVLALAMWLLAPRWGIDGAAVGLLLTTLYRATATYLSYRLLLGVAAPRLWPESRQVWEWLRRLRAGAPSRLEASER